MLATCAIAADSGEEHVKFAPKNFYDNAEAVGISGTRTALPGFEYGVGFKTNTYAISCMREISACIIASVPAIGDNHIGRMDYPYLIPIRRWTPTEVFAQEDAPVTSCFRTALTILRKQKSALWVDEPVNQTTPFCSNSDGKYRKFSIDDPPYWKAMRAK
jgi:hypothetical protein